MHLLVHNTFYQFCRRGGRNRGMEGGSGVVYRVVGRTRSKADCGQQTERQPPAAPRQDTTWKKYTDSPGVGTPPMVNILKSYYLNM